MGVRHFFRFDDDHPFTGWHMLAVTIGCFTVVIFVNTVLAVVAGGTFPGLVVKNSYVASQNYNQLLSEARAQVSSGWRLDLTTTNGLVEARFSNEKAVAQKGLVVTSFAARPSSASEDHVLSWQQIGEGYRTDAALAAGQWALDIAARRNGELVFRELRRVFVPATGGL